MVGNSARPCSDPKYVFETFDNLASCVKTYYRDAFLDDVYYADSNNTVGNVVQNCLSDYCKNPVDGVAGCGNWSDTSFNTFQLSDKYQWFWSKAACEGVTDIVNSDMAGNGVYISYLMQLAIIFYIFLILRISNLIPKIMSLFARKKSYEPAQSVEKTVTRGWKYYDQHDVAMRTTVVDFQEAQCFFMVACQIAILTARTHINVLEAFTMPALWANHAVAGMVSSAGILPIVMGTWILQQIRSHSVWMFIISAATVITSEIALYSNFNLPQIHQLAPVDTVWPSSCGGHRPPIVYCQNAYDNLSVYGPILAFGTYVNPFCLVVFCLVEIQWLWEKIQKIMDVQIGKKSVNAWLYVGDIPDSIRRRIERLNITRWGGLIVRAFPYVYIGIVELLFIASIVIDARAFWTIKELGFIKFDTWSFGQLVAITLWLPVVCKYFFWTSFGTEAYSESRLPEHYKIVKESEHDTDESEFEFTSLPTLYPPRRRPTVAARQS